MKKILILMISLVLFLGLISCGVTQNSNEIPEDYAQIPTEGNSWDYWDNEDYDDGEVITINWFVSASWSWSGSSGTLVSDMIEKKTGCRINFTTGGGDNQKLTTMIAGNNLPDVVTCEVGDSTRIQLAEQKYVYSITGLAKRYAPNMLNTYSQEIQSFFAASDGELYGCPQLFYADEDIEAYEEQGGYIIPNRVMCARRDLVNWYKNSYPEDYKTITTPDGFIKFLKAVIDNKDESGYDTDTKTYSAVQIAPWTATSESETVSLLREYFAVPREDTNGDLVESRETDEYKEVLLFLNRLYREGYISQSAMTETENVGANIQNGRPIVTIVTPQNYQSNFYNYNKSHYNQKNPDAGSDYIPILITNSNGDTPVINNLVGSGYLYSMITTNCKRPDRVIKLFDYLNSEEGQMLMLYGVEGITYEWEVEPGGTDDNGVLYKYGKTKVVDDEEVKKNIAKGLATSAYGRLQIFTNRVFNLMTSDNGFNCDTLTSYLLFNQKAAMTPYTYNPKLFGLTMDATAPNYQKMVTISNNIKDLWLQRVAEIVASSSEAAAISKYELAVQDQKKMGSEQLLAFQNECFKKTKKQYGVKYVWAPLLDDYESSEVNFLGDTSYNIEIPDWVWKYAN